MLRKHKLLRTKSSRVKAGMTLVELIVVLSIFAIISTIVIINYNDSKSRASLHNLAEDIGLSIRRAQSRAIGIQVTDIAGSEQSKGYGIHFSTEQAIASAGSGGSSLPQCSDFIDNDIDGFKDNDDPSCWTDPLDPATYDANLDDEGASGVVSFNYFKIFTRAISKAFADTGPDSVTGNNKSIVFFTDLACIGDTPNREYDYPDKPDMPVFSCNPNPSTTPVCDRANLGPGNECTDILNITSTDVVSAICINTPDEQCNERPGEVSTLDIVFIRPNPDAYFCYTAVVPSGGISSTCESSGISNAQIVVKSQAGDIRTINVWNTGQISVK